MEAITLPILNTQGKEVDTLKLDATVFDGVVNEAVIQQAITAYRANQRRGLASTKTRGEVSGGGKKPWKQKGTGRSRHGSTRSPLWKHGGVVFGPHPRDFSYDLPRKIKNLALKSGLNAKVKESNFIILDSIELGEAKTKEAAKVMASLKLNNKYNTLLLLEKIDVQLRRALRNIGSLCIDTAGNAHVYEVMAARKMVITKDGLQALVKRLKQ
ncbi:MAG: 50S ribosomal protein L4 [Candidatus Omnitrophica bacterium]|jgi:large subunit ribosomal protein L4|nr:50S ribosomal protein L4 [Candidatus Omnitrophota bacterium]